MLLVRLPEKPACRVFVDDSHRRAGRELRPGEPSPRAEVAPLDLGESIVRTHQLDGLSALSLILEATEDLPELRVGLACGTVLARLGDLYGEPVNLAHDGERGSAENLAGS